MIGITGGVRVLVNRRSNFSRQSGQPSTGKLDRAASGSRCGHLVPVGRVIRSLPVLAHGPVARDSADLAARNAHGSASPLVIDGIQGLHQPAEIAFRVVGVEVELRLNDRCGRRSEFVFFQPV